MQVRLEVVVLILEEPVVPKPIQDKLEDPKPLIQMEEMGVRITYSILLNYLVIISFVRNFNFTKKKIVVVIYFSRNFFFIENIGIDFSKAERTADGRLCVIKESEVESIAKDPILECTHKNVEKCHYTYVTQFEAAQEEICQENFEKLCQITFKQQAIRETVTKCYKPQRKVCNGQGPDECRTVYESSCTTRYIEKQPGKLFL